jgi:AAHS family benzoate transporter-like MFS transporter
MVSSALFGMMFGAIFLGTIADRIGRRWAIVICIVLFSVFTAAAGMTSDPVTFSVTRFLAGLGIGGVMPNVVAQMTEYSPRKMRSTLVTLMFSGYAVGGMLAAVLGKGLIESLRLAVGVPGGGHAGAAHPRHPQGSCPSPCPSCSSGPHRRAQGHRPAHRSGYRPPPTTASSCPPTTRPTRRAHRQAVPGRARLLSTVMFWVAFFMCLFMVYALSSWLTKLMAAAGYSLGSALTFVLVLNFGAMIGAVGGGWLADRFHIKRVLIGMYALAAVSITLLGSRCRPTHCCSCVVGLAGAITIGTQIVTYAYVRPVLPDGDPLHRHRLGSGMGRSGAILAPDRDRHPGGHALPLEQNFMAIAIPAVIAAVAVLLINHSRSASAHHFDVSAEVPSMVFKK